MLEEFSKFQVTVSQSRDNISGLEQQLHLQTADLGNEEQKLHEELQNVKQEMLALREQKERSEKEMQDKVTDVQGSVLQLQAERKELHGTTTQLLKDQKRQQSHTEDLYKIMKELEEKTADNKQMKIVEDIEANMQILETKVLLCDTAASQLNKTFLDLLNNICGHEENCHHVNEKIFRELDCKVNHTEMDRLKKQLEDYKLDAQHTECHDAAIVKKPCLTHFNCLSCDRPVDMNIPGPPMLVLPKPPSFPPSKHYRRPRQWTNLDESAERSPTEGSMEQTSYCRKEDKVNHSQLPTSSRRKTRRLLPLREQLPKTELIRTDSSCLENEKLWHPKDSFPKILQSRQRVSTERADKNLMTE